MIEGRNWEMFQLMVRRVRQKKTLTSLARPAGGHGRRGRTSCGVAAPGVVRPFQGLFSLCLYLFWPCGYESRCHGVRQTPLSLATVLSPPPFFHLNRTDLQVACTCMQAKLPTLTSHNNIVANHNILPQYVSVWRQPP